MIIDGKEYRIKKTDYALGGYKNDEVITTLILQPCNKGKEIAVIIEEDELLPMYENAP
jgi:hypothetical protein